MSAKRQRFGRVRRLPSGRFQARYTLADGQLRSAPGTFATEADAERYLATVETDMARGTWLDPEAGEIRLDVYASRWLVERPVELQPRTAEVYVTYVDAEPAALVFTKASAVSLDRNNFHTMWRRATRAAGVQDYHFHDLRHLAATLAAVSGATRRELMHRMGHSSSRAALIYQHATEGLAVAAAMSNLVAPTDLTPRPGQAANG